MPNRKSKIENQKSPTPFAGKRVLIMGLGHFGGGIGAAQWFAAQNARVTVTDAAKEDQLADSLRALQGLPITYKLGGHDLNDFTSADLLVVNPAVDRSQSPFVQAALRARVPTTTEINLFLERCPALTVGITGSVGKSTTTALIHHALQAALHAPADPSDTPASPVRNDPKNIENRKSKIENPSNVFLGGNIGRSLLADLPRIRPTDIVVLELSSFMLEETPHVRSSRFSVSPDAPPKSPGWSPNIAVITNLFPNHLDRHSTIEAYAAAKQNILRFQRPTDLAILNADHELVSGWDALARGKVLKFTTANLPRLDLVMPGMHNQSNARAALAVVDALATHPSVLSPQHSPLDLAAAHAAILNFPGLAHRLQCVHTIDLPGTTPPRRLRFFNDSKATSPQASVIALQTFDPGTAVFIVGGFDRHLPDAAWETFDHLLVDRAAAVLGIGTTGPAMIARLQAQARGTRNLRAESVGTLERAVQLGVQWALELGAEALVLSPASASWDQFPNYEKRGDAFAKLGRSESLFQK